MNDAGKVLFAALVGAAAGAVAGILLAPAAGEETRSKLESETRRLKQKLSEKFDDLTEMGSEKIHELKNTATKVRSDANKATSDASKVANDAKKIASDIKS